MLLERKESECTCEPGEGQECYHRHAEDELETRAAYF